VKFLKQSLSLLLSCCIVLASAPGGLAAQADQSALQPPVQAAPQTPEQLQQLVAPIALYENGAWYFNSKTGTQEILRRVGENETIAIEVCEEFALTKTEANSPAVSQEKAVSQDPITRFAQSLVTVGTATADRNARATGQKEPYLFHGYYFRRVSGNLAVSGAKKKGLALVAYPADYRSSGVKTFIVTQKGIVFEKDLGPSTATVAPSISMRSSGWLATESGRGTESD